MHGTENAYPTHEITKADCLLLFLARNRHVLVEIHYSTFYYAETNTYILFLTFSFCKTADDPFAILAVHKLYCILAWHYGYSIIRECN